jgi:fatty-acid peroxygenase
VSGAPTHVLLDRTLSMLRQGYRFLPEHRRRYGADLFEIRVLGQRTICLVGAEAARLLYDSTRFRRAGALPLPVRRTLVGEHGVQTLDDTAHRARKAVFMDLMAPARVDALTDLTAARWGEAIAGWPRRGRVVLFDEAVRVLARAACDWVGVPLPDHDAPVRARDLASMVDGFATAGPRHWRARLARRRSERWVAGVVGQVRRGDLAVPAETPLHVIAAHRDPTGAPLDERTAAVEVLNLIRPTVAIAWYVVFAAHALHYHPQWRERLRGGGDDVRERFVQEVRRFYPFAPAVGARVRRDFTWRGHRFPRGRRVLLDVYGTDHDPARWPRAGEFDPDRFVDRPTEPFTLIPQGGGDPHDGHRCPGEPVTIALTRESLRQLIGLDYQVPSQDLDIPLDRIPTRPRSGFVLTGVRGLVTAR